MSIIDKRIKEWDSARSDYIRDGHVARWRLENWLYNMSVASENMHTLTEEEWLEACRYFEGCAYCGSEDISTRGFLIPFKDGGEYAAWNVLPLCDKCGTRSIRQPNIFRTFKARLGYGASAVSNHIPNAPTSYYSARQCTSAEEQKFLKAVRYLMSKMGDQECLLPIE